MVQKTTNIWDVNVDKLVISKLVETKTNCKYLIGYLNKVIGPLVLVLPEMSGNVKTFKVIVSFGIDDEKLLEKYKTIWTKIEDLKSIELNVLPVSDDRHIKTKIRTYGDKGFTNVCGSNVPENDIECESFTVISIDSLLAYKSNY